MEEEDLLLESEKPKFYQSKTFASILTLTTVVSSILVDVFVSNLSTEIGSIQLSFIRYFTVLICGLPPAWRSRNFTSLSTFSAKIWIIIILAAATKAFSTFPRYESFMYISVMDSTAIYYTKQIYAAIASCLFLKIYSDKFEVFSIVISVVGMIFICQPSFVFGNVVFKTTEFDHDIGILLATSAALLITISLCGMKYSSAVPVTYVLVLQGLSGSSLGGLLMACGIQEVVLPKGVCDTIAFLSTGVLSVYGQSIEIYVLKILTPSEYAVLRTLEIPAISVIQWVVLQTKPSFFEIIGATLVAAASVIIALKNLKAATKK